MNQIHNPHIPHNAIIPGGMFPGRIIRIMGTVPTASHKFNVDLISGRDVALHLSPHLQSGHVVRNALQHGHWGHEEKHGHMPVYPGQSFELLILCDPLHYKIAFNGAHFTEFHHRVPFQSVTNMAIDGHIIVSLLSFEGGSTGGSMGFAPHPPTYAPVHPPYAHAPPHASHPGAFHPGASAPYPVQPGVHHPSYPPQAVGHAPYPTQPGHTLYPGYPTHATGGHSPTHHKKMGLLDKAGMAVAGALGAASLGAVGGHKYNKLGALGAGGGGLGAALAGAALTGHLNPKKAMKKQAKAQRKAMKLAGLGLGAGVGAYALHKGVHKLHRRSSSSSSSSSSD